MLRFTETIEIHRRQSRDRHGDDVYALDHTERAAFAPGESVEYGTSPKVVSRDTTKTAGQFFLPTTADVLPHDKIVYLGDEYKVIGVQPYKRNVLTAGAGGKVATVRYWEG